MSAKPNSGAVVQSTMCVLLVAGTAPDNVWQFGYGVWDKPCCGPLSQGAVQGLLALAGPYDHLQSNEWKNERENERQGHLCLPGHILLKCDCLPETITSAVIHCRCVLHCTRWCMCVLHCVLQWCCTVTHTSRKLT